MDLNTIIEILKSVSIIIASFVAIYGINSWRREAKWKRKYKIAEEVLSLFYEIEEAISIIRSPFGYTDEGKTRKRGKNENPDNTELLDRAYTVIERFEKNGKPFHKLRALKFRFISLFGKDSAKPFNDVIKLTNRIIGASNRLGQWYWPRQGREKFSDSEFHKHLKEMHEYEAIIWEDFTSDGKDDIKEKMKSIIEDAESICNKVLRKK
jgi:hypothetical protein